MRHPSSSAASKQASDALRNDYWSDKVRRSILIDSNADILLYGNAERALVDLATELAAGKSIEDCWDMRGTARVCDRPPEGWTEIDSTRIDWPAKIDKLPNPMSTSTASRN